MRGVPPLRLARLLALLVILAYPFAAGALLLSSDGWSINRLNVQMWYLFSTPGIRAVTSPELYAAGWNVLLFIPFFAALGLWIPRWWWVPLGIATSAAVEIYQAGLGTRRPEVGDLLTNTTGTIIGVALGIALYHRFRPAPAGRDHTPSSALVSASSSDAPQSAPPQSAPPQLGA